MSASWSATDLQRDWTLSASEVTCIGERQGRDRLGFALLLLYFRHLRYFPRTPEAIHPDIVAFVADQVAVAATAWSGYPQWGHARARHQNQIRAYFGFRPLQAGDREAMIAWLMERMDGPSYVQDYWEWSVRSECVTRRIEVPPLAWIRSVITQAHQRYDAQVFATVMVALPAPLRQQLDDLVRRIDASALMTFRFLCPPPRPPRLTWPRLMDEIARLQWLRTLPIPAEIFPLPIIDQVYFYACTAERLRAGGLRQAPPAKRYALLVALLRRCEQDIPYQLDCFLEDIIWQLIDQRRHPRMAKELDIPASATPLSPLCLPEAVSMRHLPWHASYYPSVFFYQRICTMLRAYTSTYRQMAGAILNTLTFVDTTGAHGVVLDAIDVIRQAASAGLPAAPLTEWRETGGIVPPDWRALLWPTGAATNAHTARLIYEICLLLRLRMLLIEDDIVVARGTPGQVLRKGRRTHPVAHD